MKLCTHIPTRPSNQCHFKMFYAASWWRYNRHIPLVSMGACLWTESLRRCRYDCSPTLPSHSLGVVEEPLTAFYHLHLSQCHQQADLSNTHFLDSTPPIIVHTSHESVPSISIASKQKASFRFFILLPDWLQLASKVCGSALL